MRADDGHGGNSDVATATVAVGMAAAAPGLTVIPTPTAPGLTVIPTPTAPGLTLIPTPTPVPLTTLKIVVPSPKAGVYRVGHWLKLNIVVTDKSGGVRWVATLTRAGGKPQTVKQGARLRLSRTGTYVLRVTAKDRWGHSASKTVRIRVVRK